MLQYSLVVFIVCAVVGPGGVPAQSPQQGKDERGADLRYVVYLSRHGVRSPTAKPSQYDQYSVGAWPKWPVAPGYLTAHGFQLMETFGGYDRALLATEGLWAGSGCGDASLVTVYADSDQRTRETGKALAQGLMPGCQVDVQGLPEGTNDPLFHATRDDSGRWDPAVAKAAVEGRAGGDAANVTAAYREGIAELDHVLATCGSGPAGAKRTSLLDIPVTLAEGSGDHLVEMKGPLNTASTLAEVLLLEYTEGMAKADVGWGCVGRAEMQSLISLHTAATDFTQRTPYIARAQAAGLLRRIGLSVQQAAQHKTVQGALGGPADKALFLVGHDTNLENIAGTLNLTWIIDGRRDDTPPGGALVFELWQTRATGAYRVRAYFTAQTLDQMRTGAALTMAAPAPRAEVFIPGCSGADGSCPLASFLKLVE